MLYLLISGVVASSFLKLSLDLDVLNRSCDLLLYNPVSRDRMDDLLEIRDRFTDDEDNDKVVVFKVYLSLPLPISSGVCSNEFVLKKDDRLAVLLLIFKLVSSIS